MISSSYFHKYFQFKTHQAVRKDIFQPSRNSHLYGLISIKYLGANLWNDIATYIKISSFLNVFRSKLKDFLINGYSL